MGKVWYEKVDEKKYKIKMKLSRIIVNDVAKKIRRGVTI